MAPVIYQSEGRWNLPPLILHPFADASGPAKLVESSRATLMLQGLLPRENFTQQELDASLIEGRFCEIRMLYYVGKDLVRWIEQCMEVVGRDRVLRSAGIEFQSFAALLTDDPPALVRDKLTAWGVVDFKAIFSRGIGLNMIFAEAPTKDNLTVAFVRNYYRYADSIFACHQGMKPFAGIRSRNFAFDLFASGEYSRKLEREWQEN
jgi:hypothetical protein